MGEVYRARDPRLGREVAIKVLPSHLSASPELQRRLEREAKAISQLSHPHICTLHDVGREGETDFLVMEYLEGETLAHRLEKGALPLEQALRTASEIADALDKAHRQGVVHRDLKPGNIMLTKSGAKLLDFGLAKLRDVGAVEEVAAESALPTEARPLTEEGKIVGTYPYMAPEQLEGEKADARTDVFAFGSMLYEMVTGQRAFRGESRASLIAAIMSSEPRPISELQPMTPPLLDRVVKRCLEKDPEQRSQSAGDLAAELRWIVEGVTESDASSHPLIRPLQRDRLVLAASVVAAAVLAAASTAVYFRPARPAGARSTARRPNVTRFLLSLPDDLRVAHFYRHGITLSPDGKWMAYLGGAVEGPLTQANQIYLRPLDHWESRPIPGTTDARNITFSPDSLWIAFAQHAAGAWALKRVSISTGQIFTVCGDLRGYGENGNGISWGDDDWLVFDGDGPDLKRVPAKGGQPVPANIRLPDMPLETRLQLPSVLPGSRSVLFTAVRYHGNLEPRFTDIYVWSADTGQSRRLIEGATDARYVPTGHIIFAREGHLLTVPFDKDRLELTGPEVQSLSGVNHSAYFGWTQWETGAAQYSVSDTGLLAYVSGSVIPEEKFELVWVDRRGREEVLDLGQQRLFSSVRVSPDGRLLALARPYPPYAVWIHDLERRTTRRQTFKGRTVWAVWGPESDTFTYESDLEGPTRIYQRVIGSGPEEHTQVPTGEGSGWHIPGSWSPDGKTLVFMKPGRGGSWDLWTTSDGQTSRLTDTESDEGYPEFSPNGRWIAYTSDESGRNEVYVRPYGREGRTYQVSTQTGREAAWSRDGSEIVFRRSDSTSDGPGGFFFVTFVETDGSVQLGKPVLLFEDRYDTGFPGRSYDVTANGRFLLRRRVAGDAQRFVDSVFPTRIHVVQNWFEEVKASMRESDRAGHQASQ